MRYVMRTVLLLLVALVALPADSAWAQRRSTGHHHRHSHTVVVGSAFYFGSPMWYAYHYPPYYYGPLYEPTSALPAMYIEKFEGQPDANAGDIFCPALGQYYPDVQECPTGWQRIIQPAGTAAQGGG